MEKSHRLSTGDLLVTLAHCREVEKKMKTHNLVRIVEFKDVNEDEEDGYCVLRIEDARKVCTPPFCIVRNSRLGKDFYYNTSTPTRPHPPKHPKNSRTFDACPHL